MPVFDLTEAELRARTSLKWNRYPADVLPMWVAEMDSRPHPQVGAALTAAAERGDTGYAWGRQYPQAFQRMAANRWNWEIPDSLIIPAQDVVANMLHCVLTLTEPGDGVVVNPPIYPPFRQVVQDYSRRVVEAPLTEAGRLDFGTVEAAFRQTPKPALWLLCSPHNPTGTVHTAAELQACAAIAAEYGVQLVVDEIHQLLVDPDADTPFIPVLTLPGSQRVAVTTSAGKAWNVAGLKGGLIMAGPEAPMDKIRHGVERQGGHLAYIAHTAAITHAQGWVDEVRAEVAANKLHLAAELARRLPEARYLPAPGTYLAWVDCSGLGLDDPQRAFLERGRVAFNSGSEYGQAHRKWVRVNLACRRDFVTEAVARMAACV
ncbi:MAG: aminotransferase class I/II-fold pyridoxal phosphate-dependent enzyme [Propionibacteriaceae bacterium]|jgi:cystathionine beta-lyase|nr:aminotransferase class I/II-fold pyridoxal phosphate-dependent enzyme [Propionibacteriaceae bacterium]